MPEKKRVRTRRLVFLLIALLPPLLSGCLFVAIGAGVGAGAAGYYALTHRLYRDYPKDLSQTADATRLALADLRFPTPKEDLKDDVLSLETKAPDGAKIAIDLRTIAGRVPADGTTTRVGIHIGMIGDEESSERILNQINVRLGVPLPVQAPPPPPPQQQGQTQMRPVPQGAPPVVGETAAPPLAR